MPIYFDLTTDRSFCAILYALFIIYIICVYINIYVCTVRNCCAMHILPLPYCCLAFSTRPNASNLLLLSVILLCYYLTLLRVILAGTCSLSLSLPAQLLQNFGFGWCHVLKKSPSHHISHETLPILLVWPVVNAWHITFRNRYSEQHTTRGPGRQRSPTDSPLQPEQPITEGPSWSALPHSILMEY